MDGLGCGYSWISSLPPLSQWDVSQQSCNIGDAFIYPPVCDQKDGSSGRGRGLIHLIVRREDVRVVTVYLKFLKDGHFRDYWGTIARFRVEQLKLIPPLLFKYFHSCISVMLSGFEKDGFNREHNDLPSLENLSDVDSAVTEKPSYPLVFDSLMLYICCLVRPPTVLDDKIYRQLTSTDVLLGIGPQFQTLYLHFLQFTCNISLPFVVSTPMFSKIGIQCHAFRPIERNLEIPKKLRSTMLSEQLNCTIQLKHHVDIKDNFIQAQVHVDNLICDVLPFKILPKHQKERCIWTERYFPSKIVISVVPQCQTNEMILSLSQSTDNPEVQTYAEQFFKWGIKAPNEISIGQSSTTSSTQTASYWKFLQTAEGANGSFEWILSDPLSGVEVISSKPLRKSFFKSDPKTWYTDRYKKSCSPLNHKGGVVFAADKYGSTLTWTMNKNMEGKTLKLQVQGSIWLTYWPNLYNTSFYDTTKHDFCEEVELELIQKLQLTES